MDEHGKEAAEKKMKVCNCFQTMWCSVSSVECEAQHPGALDQDKSKSKIAPSVLFLSLSDTGLTTCTAPRYGVGKLTPLLSIRSSVPTDWHCYHVKSNSCTTAVIVTQCYTMCHQALFFIC